MKKTTRTCFLLVLALALQLVMMPAASTAASEPSRIINVVYDDSGSMYMGANMMWSQAKYAAEVFAAMLGTNDSMNLYLMSDFLASPSIRTPRLQLNGRSGADANVKAVHDMVTTRASNTPFGVVELAYNDLLAKTADEKWLVILTDGDFNQMSKAQENAFFESKSQDVRVYYLAMGDDLTLGIRQDEDNDMFFAHAVDGNDVLENAQSPLYQREESIR